MITYDACCTLCNSLPPKKSCYATNHYFAIISKKLCTHAKYFITSFAKKVTTNLVIQHD